MPQPDPIMEFIKNFTSDTGLMIMFRSVCCVLPFLIVCVLGFLHGHFEVSRRKGGEKEGKWKMQRAVFALAMVIVGIIFVGGLLWGIVTSRDEKRPQRFIPPTEAPTTQPNIPISP